MPDLRLSNNEAADITAYLLTLKNKEFDQNPTVKYDKDQIIEIENPR